jgi:hypothetical protein
MSAQSRLDASIERINATSLAKIVPIAISTLEGPTVTTLVDGKRIELNEIWINCSSDADIDKKLSYELIYYALGRRVDPTIADEAFKAALEIEHRWESNQ